MRIKVRNVAIAVIGLMLTTRAPSDAGVTPDADLRSRIAGLASRSAGDDVRIAELAGRLLGLEAVTPAGWLNEQRAIEIRDRIEAVLADADTQTSTLRRVLLPVDLQLTF